MESNISIKSGSSLRICRVENSITPATCSPTRIGNANEACNPSAIANGTRGKFSACGKSASHIGCEVSQTCPGTPTDLWYVDSRVAFTNCGKLSCGECHTFMQRRTPAISSTRHSTPKSQLRPSQIAINING